jgi:hypothetical protein
VLFVDLSTLSHGAQVIPAIAGVLGIREGGDQSVFERLQQVLAGGEHLLLLDNFEHVLAAATAGPSDAGAPLDPSTASASAPAAAIRARAISSEELVHAVLCRIEAVNPLLNAVVQLRSDAARAEARAADTALARGEVVGPLHGAPVTIKDAYDVAGTVSTGGTLWRRSFVPRKDAVAVARLRAAGAVVLGKTNVTELSLSIGRTIEVSLVRSLPRSVQVEYAAGFSVVLEVPTSTATSIRAWWSWRCLVVVRWLFENGLGPIDEYPEIAVLTSQK